MTREKGEYFYVKAFCQGVENVECGEKVKVCYRISDGTKILKYVNGYI